MAGANIAINADTFKDISKMPKAVQCLIYVLVICIVVGIGYFVFFSKQLMTLEAAENQETELRTTYETSVVRAASLPDLIKEMEQLKSAFAVLLKQLPDTVDSSSVVQEIHQAAATNSVTTYLIQPGSPRPDGPVEVIPYSIEVRGEYDQVLRFITDVGQLSRLITVSDITLTPEKGNQFILSGMANTYRSLDSGTDAAKGGQ